MCPVVCLGQHNVSSQRGEEAATRTIYERKIICSHKNVYMCETLQRETAGRRVTKTKVCKKNVFNPIPAQGAFVFLGGAVEPCAFILHVCGMHHQSGTVWQIGLVLKHV